MLRTAVSLVIARRFWVVLVIALLTVFLGLQVKNLRIVIDPNTMLPQDHPNVIGTNLAEAIFGSKHVVVVGISATDGGKIYRRDVLDTVTRLSDKLGLVPGARRHTLMSISADQAKAISGSESELLVERMFIGAARDIDTLQAKLAQNPIYQGTLVSKDETVASVSFAIKAGQSGFREIMDRVDEIVDDERSQTVRITLSGTPVFFAAVERFAQRMVILFPIAVVLIGLIHFEAFRTVQGLVLPLVTALLAVVWGLGIMGFANVPMDAFNATTPILILAIAAGHAVQILKRYYEEYDRTAAAHPEQSAKVTNDQAILESLNNVAPVMITAGLVAALGFFSLVTFHVATIRTFGIFTGLGILCALLIELTFIPALRSYLSPPKPQLKDPGAPPTFWDRFSSGITATVLRRRYAIVIGFLALAMVSSLGLLNINRENSTKSYFGDDLPVRVDDRFLNSKLAGTNTLYVVFQADRPDRMKDPEILQVIEGAQRFIETLPGVGKTASIVDLIKQMNRSMNDGHASAYALPASPELVSQYLLLYSMSGAPTDFDAYIDYEYKDACLIVWIKDDSSKYAESLVTAIQDHVQARLPDGVRIQIGGSVPQSSALSETLVEGKMMNIAQMITVVFIAGAIVLRSVLAGFYLVVPLLVTVLVNFGVMGVTGIPLNTPNSVSSALAIGIGADYTIYIIYRLREEMARTGGDFDRALQETMRTAGKAVIYVATAIAGGYSVLMLSFGFYVHIWFGVLIVLSMIVSAASALILVPALLKSVPPGFLRYHSPALPKAATAALLGALTLGSAAMTSGAAKAQSSSTDDIMERSYQATRVDNSLSDATFRLISASGQERVRKTTGATKMQPDSPDDNRRVIRFLSPSDVRNTTTLLVEHSDKDDEIWIYLPATKKVRRIAGSNKSGSFVGTDLSYGDMVGHNPQDWTHKLVGEEVHKGVSCYVVESLPKSPKIAEESGYSKRVSLVANDSFVPVRIDFFDPAGNLLKTANNSEWKLVDAAQKKWQAMEVTVKNNQTEHRTVVRLEKFDANVGVSERYFSIRYLEDEE